MVNTPRIMKKFKRALPVAMAIVLGSTAAPLVVRADSSKVVTLGANLTDSQKNSMYEYFGTSSDKADVIEVTNADESKYPVSYTHLSATHPLHLPGTGISGIHFPVPL